jgi:hypothetical protein
MADKLKQYHTYLRRIAFEVSEANRFQPVVYWTPNLDPLEFGIVDTATPNEDGEPSLVGIPYTLDEAIETAYSWSVVPQRAANDWSGIL